MTVPSERAPVDSDDETPPSEDPLYTDFDISEELQQARDTSHRDSDWSHLDVDTPDGHDSLQELLDEARDVMGSKFDSIADYVSHKAIDAVPKDDTINSTFPTMGMAQAYVLKILSPDITSYDRLQWKLEQNAEIAEAMGFDPDDIPDHSTFSTQWWERYRPAFRTHLKAEAANAAVQAKHYGFEVSEEAEGLIQRFDYSDDESEDKIPDRRRIENERRDQVFNEFSELFNNVLDYDRGSNASIPTEDLTEL